MLTPTLTLNRSICHNSLPRFTTPHRPYCITCMDYTRASIAQTTTNEGAHGAAVKSQDDREPTRPPLHQYPMQKWRPPTRYDNHTNYTLAEAPSSVLQQHFFDLQSGSKLTITWPTFGMSTREQDSLNVTGISATLTFIRGISSSHHHSTTHPVRLVGLHKTSMPSY